MREFACDAAGYFAPKLIGVKSGAELNRPVIVELVQFKKEDCIPTVPRDDHLLDFKKTSIEDADFDDHPSERTPLAKSRRNGGE